MRGENYAFNLSMALGAARRDPRWLVTLPRVLPPPEELQMDPLELIACVGTFITMYPEHQQDSKLDPQPLFFVWPDSPLQPFYTFYPPIPRSYPLSLTWFPISPV